MDDIRLNDHYLTEDEKEAWEKRNSLFNTVWFYVYKRYMPDVEYSDTAIKFYRRLPYFSKWSYMYKSNGGKVLVSPKMEVFSADLMTGWWNPFKMFIKMDGRNSLNKDFLGTIPEAKDGIIEWLMDKSNATESECNSFLQFLDVVYTPGNLIPAPVNWKGQGPDTWDYKLKKIRENETTDAKKWNKYIEDYYNRNMQDFIKQNCLEMYFRDDLEKIELKPLWDENIVWCNATVAQWAEYFKKAKNSIEKRNECFENKNKMSL